MVNSNVQFCQSFWLFLCCISVTMPALRPQSNAQTSQKSKSKLTEVIF